MALESFKRVQQRAKIQLRDGNIAIKMTKSVVHITHFPNGSKVSQKERPRRVVRKDELVTVLENPPIR